MRGNDKLPFLNTRAYRGTTKPSETNKLKIQFWDPKMEICLAVSGLSHEVNFSSLSNWYKVIYNFSPSCLLYCQGRTNIYKYYILCDILPWSPYLTCTTDELCAHVHMCTCAHLDSEEKLTSWLRPETARQISILGSKNWIFNLFVIPPTELSQTNLI